MNRREEQKLLNELIEDNIWGPGGDPNEHNLRSAAAAFLLLEAKNMHINDKANIESILRKDNVYGEDFLG